MDKRTKEYKDWKKKHDNSPDGIGDTIDAITSKTGIKKVVKAIFNDDCGCDERRRKLNRVFPYKPKGCFTEHQYIAWTEFRNRPNKNVVNPDDQKLIHELLKDIYMIAIKNKCASCNGSMYKRWIQMIDKFYESY